MEALKAMSKQVDSQPRGETKNMKSLMRFNDLVYEEMANASLISQRHFERFNSQSLNYSNDSSSVDFIFQTGEQLISGEDSCIQFDLVVTTDEETDTFNFSDGSACNVFKSCILHSRGGDEIDRIRESNVYRANVDLHEDQTWFQTTGSIMGYSEEEENYATGTPNFFQIPLNKLLNIFGTGRLIPSQLISGARLQLDIEKNPQRLFKFNVQATNVTFEINNVRMVCCVSRPTDAVQNELEKQSASNSLEFTWPAVYTQKRAVGTELNEQVSKSVARALTVRVCPLKNTPINNDLNMVPVNCQYEDAQIRAGSVYFPQYKLSNDEIYHASLSAVGKLGKSVRNSKSESRDSGDIWVTSLESHSLINYSGTSLNNSRVLYVETSFTSDIDGLAYIFLDYQKSARCYLNSIALDE